MTKWVIVQHRGTISVTSAPGEGAVFTITLPSLSLFEKMVSAGGGHVEKKAVELTKKA